MVISMGERWRPINLFISWSGKTYELNPSRQRWQKCNSARLNLLEAKLRTQRNNKPYLLNRICIAERNLQYCTCQNRFFVCGHICQTSFPDSFFLYSSDLSLTRNVSSFTFHYPSIFYCSTTSDVCWINIAFKFKNAIFICVNRWESGIWVQQSPHGSIAINTGVHENNIFKYETYTLQYIGMYETFIYCRLQSNPE